MEKKQVKIPGYLIAIIITVLLSGIFLFAVMVPFLQQKPDYDEKHESAEKEKASLNPYVENKESIQASIDLLKADYNKKNKVLFQNSRASIRDVVKLIKDYGVKVSYVQTTNGVADASITTVEGGALKKSSVNLTIKATESKYREVLDFIEIDAPRTYYIEHMDFQNTETIEDSEGNKIEVSADDVEKTYNLNISLYYFEDVTGLSDEENAEGEEASGEQAEGSTDASTVSAA